MNIEQPLFTDQKYLNLETFRKSGVGVRTPVWFVQEGEIFYIRTIAHSGKVKRIRNHGQVNIAACKMDGEVVGDWVQAEAKEVTGGNIDRKVDELLDKKYGLVKKMFALAGGMNGRKYTIIELKVRQ